MIGPVYDSANFPNFPTWDDEDGGVIYYADAFRFCAQLTYDGYDDWRLPSVTAMHNYIQDNPQQQFIIPNHATTGWTTFWLSSIPDSPTAGFNSTTNLSYIVPVVNISGPTHATLPNQILYYVAMGTYLSLIHI